MKKAASDSTFRFTRTDCWASGKCGVTDLSLNLLYVHKIHTRTNTTHSTNFSNVNVWLYNFFFCVFKLLQRLKKPLIGVALKRWYKLLRPRLICLYLLYSPCQYYSKMLHLIGNPASHRLNFLVSEFSSSCSCRVSSFALCFSIVCRWLTVSWLTET